MTSHCYIPWWRHIQNISSFWNVELDTYVKTTGRCWLKFVVFYHSIKTKLCCYVIRSTRPQRGVRGLVPKATFPLARNGCENATTDGCRPRLYVSTTADPSRLAQVMVCYLKAPSHSGNVFFSEMFCASTREQFYKKFSWTWFTICISLNF